jgi:DNA mismatch repair protein MutL
MNIIYQLPKFVSNQIAAGEVVQRPSSVAKELLENSIDAKAKNIKIIIKDAGKQSINIIDDGIGMSKEDAIKCFNRHSTSKLKNAEDLFKIKTMGFRGEALSSISAVSDIILKTKSIDDEIGYEINIKNSKIIKEHEIDKNQGTSIIVKNIFFTVPARRNFLKSNKVELKYIIDEFIRIAISNPNINFILLNNELEIYNLKSSTLSKRIISLFKKSYEQQLVLCDEKFGNISIHGFIGKPEYSKKTRGEQFIFVNNRFIKSNYLNHAIIKSYEGLIEEKKYPFYVLFLQINTNKVDVNIHPTKTEVKFEDEKLLYNLMNSSVSKSLGSHHITPSIDFNADINFSNKTVIEYDNKEYQNIRPSNSSNKQNWKKIFDEVKTEHSNDKLIFENDLIEIQNKPVQFLDNFIFKQLGKKLLIFNHKNCQQRILYEKFKNSSLNSNANSQQNLFPKYIEFNNSDFQLIKEMLNDIKSIGFNIDVFGKNSVIINGVPTGLDDINEEEIIEGFIEEIKKNNQNLKAEKKEIILKSFSRKAKIINNKRLNDKEMESIINRLFTCANPKYSPDGQLNFVELGDDKIKNLF